MKKIILIAFALCTMLTLSACGGKFAKQQTPEQMAQPMNCAGLHMRNATWNFTDNYGQAVVAVGTCKKGMKHGNFVVSVNGTNVAKSKFSKDAEVKTTCLVGGNKIRTTLDLCMQANAQNTAPQGAEVSDAEAAADDNEAED